MSTFYSLEIHLEGVPEPITDSYPYIRLKWLTPEVKDANLLRQIFSKNVASDSNIRNLQTICQYMNAFTPQNTDKCGHAPEAYYLDKAGVQIPIAICYGNHITDRDRIRIAYYALGCLLFKCNVILVGSGTTRNGVARLKLTTKV